MEGGGQESRRGGVMGKGEPETETETASDELNSIAFVLVEMSY